MSRRKSCLTVSAVVEVAGQSTGASISCVKKRNEVLYGCLQINPAYPATGVLPRLGKKLSREDGIMLVVPALAPSGCSPQLSTAPHCTWSWVSECHMKQVQWIFTHHNPWISTDICTVFFMVQGILQWKYRFPNLGDPLKCASPVHVTLWQGTIIIFN